jgi:hypothetical protein
MSGRAVLVVALAAIGCSSLLGLDDFSDRPASDASVGGTSGGGAGGGSGGDSGPDATADAADGDGDTGAPFLGSACEKDAECGGTGLTCLRADTGLTTGGGPAKGYCTTTCDQCAQHGGTTCLQYADGSSFCVQGCTPQPPGGTAFDPNKCHGRPEVACVPLSGPTDAVCAPRCNSDSDCSPLYCHPKDGMCRSTPPTGDPLGHECTVTTGQDSCLGICYQGSCTEGCTLGVENTCGWAGPDGGLPAPGICGYVEEFMNFAGDFGDIGLCIPLCNCDSDCLTTGSVCEPFALQELMTKYGKSGYCSPAGAGTPCQ